MIIDDDERMSESMSERMKEIMVTPSHTKTFKDNVQVEVSSKKFKKVGIGLIGTKMSLVGVSAKDIFLETSESPHSKNHLFHFHLQLQFCGHDLS